MDNKYGESGKFMGGGFMYVYGAQNYATPVVRVHRTGPRGGGSLLGNLTPDQARNLARELLREADYADRLVENIYKKG